MNAPTPAMDAANAPRRFPDSNTNGSRAPDLAIEILSRDDDRNALYEKATLYLDNGSRVVWIVDPYQKGVMVITDNERYWVTDTLTCPELLPGFSINVQTIFSWPSAKTAE